MHPQPTAPRDKRCRAGARDARVHEPRCPQQTNCHDCGAYVLAFTHCLCSAIAHIGRDPAGDPSGHGGNESASSPPSGHGGSGRLRNKLKSLALHMHVRHASGSGGGEDAEPWSGKWVQDAVRNVDEATVADVRAQLQALVDSLREQQ